ncbi:3-hydroxyacyl-CoA dehydrogenase/enoyl-CoA hydratase family protein [Acetobacter fallax]|uniref:3-hydroxyacyl-CoA dehydrogenase n=1 Tax=Acetobacter fallax TaxID=1737473 RepID=A0ABX0K8G5_9PROT|nr:3-hydroxyacyl-CoA dehydrogenase/enoyl-CoA hydratase family protein [Acetobacter fallax]NHO32225.1 3-hydroxyacyl-CoA dehydrogenase [Acetobacter fallax]NHO35722.1 3-hydroxyacyl-CoA dehydrogenase [Acetobacter fallax]
MPSSTTTIRKCAVIGAGTMGSGIAAHLANAGADVLLLDIDPALAAAGVERQLKAGGFMLPEFAARIRTGSIRTDLALLSDRDWIVEAVAERLDIKRTLFADIATVRKPGCIVSSNTSTIPLADLVQEMDPAMAGCMLVTHFFNPPRQMRLLEMVAGPRTHPDAIARISSFLTIALGKTIVPCKDTPGFIANRIGCFWLAAGLGEALRLGIDIEAADAVMGKPFGLPRTGIFGLYDLIGIDLMPGLIRSLQDNLPETDAIHAYAAEPPLVSTLLERGLKGRKSGAGFYRVSKDRHTRDVICLRTGDYREQKPAPTLPADVSMLLNSDSIEGQYAWAVMSRTLAYAAALVPDIADRPDLVDEAMRLGYAWTSGPFELIDRLGGAWFAEHLASDNQPVPPLLRTASSGFYRVTDGTREVFAPPGHFTLIPQPAGVITLPGLRLTRTPVWSDKAATLWDIGEGVGLLEFHTKLNVFTGPLLDAVQTALALTPTHFRALVIANDGPVFSAGADLKAMLALSEAGNREDLREFLLDGQHVFSSIARAPFPVIGAASALAVGGGCEILLHTHRMALHAEARIGLVESQVGLLPGWAGIAQWLLRHKEAGLSPTDAATAVLRGVLKGATASCAFAARAEHLLRPSDGIVMNADRLIADARMLALATEPHRSDDTTFFLPSRDVLETTLEDLAPAITPHDRTIGNALADILSGTGHPVSASDLTDRVTRHFLDLALSEPSRDRMRQMIATGKPLRN